MKLKNMQMKLTSRSSAIFRFSYLLDSADVWANKELYQLDTKGHPLRLPEFRQTISVQPDSSGAIRSTTGNTMEADGYSWWIDRIKMQMKLTDYLRIDHFRGFEAYWSVPADERDCCKR